MIRYCCFLRAINISGKNKVDMKALKKVFEDLGYDNVKTYLNSGNIAFDSNVSSSLILSEEIHDRIQQFFFIGPTTCGHPTGLFRENLGKSTCLVGYCR